jgi:hypothetical protein
MSPLAATQYASTAARSSASAAAVSTLGCAQPTSNVTDPHNRIIAMHFFFMSITRSFLS